MKLCYHPRSNRNCLRSKRKESQFWDWNFVIILEVTETACALNEKNLNSEIETYYDRRRRIRVFHSKRKESQFWDWNDQLNALITMTEDKPSKRKESQFWDWNSQDTQPSTPSQHSLNEKNLNSEIETITTSMLGIKRTTLNEKNLNSEIETPKKSSASKIASPCKRKESQFWDWNQ